MVEALQTFIVVTVVLSVSIPALKKVVTLNNISMGYALSLYFYHLFFAVVYYFWSLNIPADSNGYYKFGVNNAVNEVGFDYFEIGTKFIHFLVHVMYDIFPFTKLEMFIVFSVVGYFGLLFLYASIHNKVAFERAGLLKYIFFIPGLSFWTCALGKDSLMFLPIGYLIYLFDKKQYSVIKVMVCISIMILVRPHVAALVMGALLVASFVASGSKKKNDLTSIKFRKIKFYAIIFIGPVAIAVTPMVLKFGGLSEFSIAGVFDALEYQATRNQTGDGAVNISHYNLISRLFTYMFRPFFFDAMNAVWLLVSLENVIYLLMFLSLLRLKFIKFLRQSKDFGIYFCFFTLIACWYVLGSTTANLGLALRQKIMLIPFMIYLYFCFHEWRLYLKK